uniref:Uncharacterized protein n=1 Tax=Oncorhynchus mykiss TaxID=8022 RepID=A0A8C7VY86_ONCMY
VVPAHVQQQVQSSIQQLYSKEVYFVVLLPCCVPPVLGYLAVGPEVKGDRTHSLGVPLGEAEVGVGALEVDRVQGGHVLTLKHHVTLELHLGVYDAGQTGEL